MPIPFFLGALAAIGLAGAAAVYFWPKIAEFVGSSIVPWFRTNIPLLAGIVEQAFQIIDDLVVATRQKIKAAWKKTRGFLLKVLHVIERHTSGWIRSVVSWAITQLAPDSPVHKTTTTEAVAWDELPSDIREHFTRTGAARQEVDVTTMRDQEIDSMTI